MAVHRSFTDVSMLIQYKKPVSRFVEVVFYAGLFTLGK